MSLINFYFYLKRHAIPGSIDQSRECYETIAKQHPQVIYVIHILPSKDSLEYQILKEHTLAGALVGQGVLAENALAYFKCYELDEVMANMNQWIGRRLAQITARRTAEQEKDEGISSDIWSNNNGQKAENKNWVFSKNTKFEQTKGEGGGNPSNYSSKNFQKYTRKDNYRLTVATGANATNLFSGGEGKNNFDRRSPSFNADNNFEQCVDVVLHSSSFQNNFGGRPQQTNNNIKPFNVRDLNSCNEIGRENEVLVKGYPPNFNKYQIASLFYNFRPLNVQYMEGGETLIQFANKFHAVQVIEQYNGRKYEDEGFILQVRAAAKDDPTQKIGAVKTKLASLLLMVTTSKAVGGENENTSVTSEENKEGW